ncbi:hypothetical protein [Caenispirillum salinarum]|uniref:hypothetical protein n=1 Tax=Caenispirillum salinarum TaxID=859058 RepID=UPI00384F83DA
MRLWHRTILTLAALLTAAGLAGAALNTASAQDPVRPEETYAFALPDRWQEANRTRQGNVDIITFLPSGQTMQGWRDMVILQIYRDMTAVPAESLRERSLNNAQAACEDATASTLQTGLSNGYPSAFWATACTRNKQTGLGEVAYFRSLQGNDNLYMVQRVWSMPPFGDEPPTIPEAEKREAIGILSGLNVCQPGSRQHPCPGQPGAAQR